MLLLTLKAISKAGLAVPVAVIAVIGAVLAVAFGSPLWGAVAGLALLVAGLLLAGRRAGIRAVGPALRVRATRFPVLVAVAGGLALSLWPLAVNNREFSNGWAVPGAFAAALVALLLARWLGSPVAGAVDAPAEQPAETAPAGVAALPAETPADEPIDDTLPTDREEVPS